MIEKFYSDFENVFRGSRELIKDRLRQYTPILESYLKNPEKPPSFLDLGCGRGEFLEIAHNLGFEAVGVDTNSIFVQECEVRGLKVHNQDILEFLKSQPDASYDIISLIHVAEHLDFNYLFEIFVNVHRLLKPCGIFIVETPFFKSPFVSSYTFWIDPSHKTPINPDLFSFLGKWIGFYKVRYFGINSDTSSKFEGLPDLYSYKITPDLVMFFIKECSDISIISNVEKSIQSIEDNYMSTQLENLLNSYTKSQSQQISNLNLKIENVEQSLVAFMQRYNSDYNSLSYLLNDTRAIVFLIWNSSLWRAYRRSVEVYRKMKRLFYIDTISKIKIKLIAKISESNKFKRLIKRVFGEKLFETLKRRLKGGYYEKVIIKKEHTDSPIINSSKKKIIDVGSLDAAIKQEIIKSKHKEGKIR